MAKRNASLHEVDDFDYYSLMDESEFDADRTIDVENPMLHPERYQQAAHPYESVTIEDTGFEEESYGNLDVVGQPRFNPSTSGQPKTLFNDKARPADPTKPCYAHYQGKCLNGDRCGWSHKLVDMQALYQRKVDELFGSPFIEPGGIQARLNQRRSGSTPNRHSTITQHFGSQGLETWEEPPDSESIQVGQHSNTNQVQFESGESRSNASQNSS
jgi:hypothetical protein